MDFRKKTKFLIFSALLISSVVIMSYASAQVPNPTLYIPPTNAFDKIHTDNGTISAVNFSMPLDIKSGSGITVKSNNSTHTVTISSTVSGGGSGSYNTTQANNANVNVGGYKLNFINGTGATVSLKNSGAGKQVNVTISATGTGGGCPSTCITSINSQTGPAVNIVGTPGNITVTNSTNQIKLNTGSNVYDINKPETVTGTVTYSGANVLLGSNQINTTSYNIKERNTADAQGVMIIPNSGNTYQSFGIAPLGTSTTSFFMDEGTSDISTNSLDFVFGRGFETTSNFQIAEYARGMASYIPMAIYIDTTELMSFEPAHTITSYVNQIFKGIISQYNGINTAGMGVPPIYGVTAQKSETGSDANVLTYTPPAIAGTYRLSVSIDVSASTAANLGWAASWQDSNGKNFPATALNIFKRGVAGSALTQSVSIGSNLYGDAIITVDNSQTPIVIQTAFTGTSVAYKVTAILEQLQ